MADKCSGRRVRTVRTARLPLGLGLGGALLVASLLQACGGDAGASDVAAAMACAFANCKDSPDVSVSDISASYEVVQEGTRVTAKSALGYRYNLVTAVRLRGADSLVASVGAQSRSMTATDPTFGFFAASFDAQPATPTVSVDFIRGAQVERSTVTLPKAFVLLNPLGPATLPLSAGQLLVDVSAPPDEPVTVYASGNCSRLDGTSAAYTGGLGISVQLVGALGSGSRYRVGAPAFDAAVNTAGAAKVTHCDLTVKWQRVIEGSSAAGLHPHSRIVGITQQSMTLHYDAQS
jgi:hypothetical protein